MERGTRTPDRTGAINSAGPLHRLLEGTVIDTVLTNRLDGSETAPVNCLVTNAVYSHSGQHVVIPAGARVLGMTRPVRTVGETRLAISFHRLMMPDGRTYRLDEFNGLNQIGDAGLRDKVNHHYLATFGAAAAVGLISGLAQSLGNFGLGDDDGDRTVIIAGGVGDACLTGDSPGHEPLSQQASHGHDSRRASRQGVPHQRPRTTVVRRCGHAQSASEMRRS